MTTTTQTSLAAELIAEIGRYIEPDYTAAVIAHRFGVPTDQIIDTVAEIAERLSIAEDLREDPEHAFYLHYDETYHGGDMSGLIEHELDAAHKAAERLAEKVTQSYLDMLDREAERGLAQFRADMARLKEEAGNE